ncbi:MAG TPA: heparan N-sulfatase [Bacteroidetes bacterium]|nr:heparan N-sulfatase [Bacteroidota bacterium]
MNITLNVRGFLLPGMALTAIGGCSSPQQGLPNILICIADDVSYPHMGEACSWVNTPGFDKVAREGLYFTNAYTPNAKSAPSRSCIITGRNSWQLKEAANHFCYFPAEFKTYPEVLGEHGYYTGYTGKGWAPGDPGIVNGKPRELLGKAWNELRTDPPTKAISRIDYAGNFKQFFENKPESQPFCFWYGGHEPHRRYEYGSSIRAGKKTSDVDQVPRFFPDMEAVRTDMLDYALEIEYFDLHLQRILQFLEEKGELDNTVVIVTADNGMPFPRAKSDEYEYSNHMPMAVMWKNGIIHPGRTVSDYVSFIDFAPTFLELAGVPWEESGMQPSPGQSLLPVFRDKVKEGTFREFLLIGKERHDVGRPDDLGYPIRGIIREGWLYLVNYMPELWPAGNPQTGYPTVGGSPTKTIILDNREDPDSAHFWQWSFGKRPGEELYHINQDPDCLDNMAEKGEYADLKALLREKMESELIRQDDPRMFGQGDVFMNYPYTDKRWRNGYQRIVIEKEDLVFPWINRSDIEPDFRTE